MEILKSPLTFSIRVPERSEGFSISICPQPSLLPSVLYHLNYREHYRGGPCFIQNCMELGQWSREHLQIIPFALRRELRYEVEIHLLDNEIITRIDKEYLPSFFVPSVSFPLFLLVGKPGTDPYQRPEQQCVEVYMGKNKL